MNAPESHPHPGLTETPPTALPNRATLLRVAGLAIGLGLLLETTVLVLAAGFGRFDEALAGFMEKTSWWFLVCVGLALGQALADKQQRASAMGLTGLLLTPLAFVVARFAHHGMREAILGLGEVSAPGAFPFLLALLRGLEFGFLGAAVGWIEAREWKSPLAYGSVGAATGIVFGSLALLLVAGSTPTAFTPLDLISWVLNELIFPIGCALILFSSRILERQMPAGAGG